MQVSPQGFPTRHTLQHELVESLPHAVSKGAGPLRTTSGTAASAESGGACGGAWDRLGLSTAAQYGAEAAGTLSRRGQHCYATGKRPDRTTAHRDVQSTACA